MNILAKSILRRVCDRIDTTAELARLPAVYQAAGGGLVRRIAAAGILRLALRWPAFSMILILLVVAALELPIGAADTHGNWGRRQAVKLFSRDFRYGPIAIPSAASATYSACRRA